MAATSEIVDDLHAESEALDALVAGIGADQWTLTTPAPGWTVAHQIGHLLWTDTVALLSITDEAAFGDLVTAAQAKIDTFVDEVVPLLQERGLFHDDYEGTTLRDHLGAPAQYGLDTRLAHPTA